jgi:group I intron endonuclease
MIFKIMSQTFIYTLSNSNGVVRYVGKTDNPKRRLREHLYESKKNPKNHKHYWIKSLINKGEKPILDIIDSVPISDWEFWEIFYISLFKSWGFNLTNETSGGETGSGMLGKRHKQESKDKIKFANIGINHYNYGGKLTDEHKNNLSKSLSGVNNPFYQKKHKEVTLNKIRKPILQYSIDGEFLREWVSIKDAENKLKIHSISSVCNSRLNSVGGFVWRFKKNENYSKNIIISKKYRKKVLQFSVKNEFIREFNSIGEAESKLKINHIGKVCNRVKNHNTAGGFVWKFKE